ncbi:FAD-dependent oxidoreductase [Azoarcus sp. DN11]|uniref:oxidoreductase n=1 Tax=Azoarcus sp. DN11 TaxID=356837 RepID=UPI00257112DB|nr:FAD-dependent oxidoreductase [Azoarcus sp. DN11]
MAPMSTNLAADDGAVTPRQIAYYRARALGGVGMVTVEFCCVHAASGRSEARQLSLESIANLDGHRQLVAAITSAGAVACLQLQHGGPGARAEWLEGGVAVGPSELRSQHDPERLVVRALSGAEIQQIVECFGRSAELGVQAGYQAFELHGAHGYLLTSFLSPYFNHRDDSWGGDELRRSAFARHVIGRVRQAIGNRPLIYRISADEFTAGGLSIDNTERIVPLLVEAGVDAIHVSLGLGATSLDKVIEPMSMPEGCRIPYARRVRNAAGVPVIAVGQIRWPGMADAAIAAGDADLIALGRTLLADAEWPDKARRGAEDAIRPCTSCNYCMAATFDPNKTIACAENPRTGRELDPLPDAGVARGRLAIVVGGGPGGMAAALMLDQAGFRTELHEARSRLGGGLIASAAPPFKDKLRWYQRYLERRLEESGVMTKLQSRVDAATLAERGAAVVVVASGARPVSLPIEGLNLPKVHDAYEILMSDDKTVPAPGTRPMVVYGGGETGCETSELLAAHGHAVVLVTRSPAKQLARSAELIYRGLLRRRIAANERIRVVDNSTLVSVAADGTVVLLRSDGVDDRIESAGVVIAQGRRPDNDFVKTLAAAHVPYVVVGDARHNGRIGDAVHAAYAAVKSICATVGAASHLAC